MYGLRGAAFTDEGWNDAAFKRDRDTIIDWQPMADLLQLIADLERSRAKYTSLLRKRMDVAYLYLADL